MSDLKLTVDLSEPLMSAIDDWRVKRHPAPTREDAVSSILQEWANEKTGPTKRIVDEGTRPEALNASNDD